MSTAGKVLTVLILLAMVGWIVVLSAVTQLNVNWQTKIAQQEKDSTAAKLRATELNTRILDLTEQTRAEQANKALDLRVVQGRITATQARLSTKIEDLTRAQFQLADYQAAVERAGVNLATRKAEKAKAEENLAAKRVEVAKRQEENAQLRDQLARLQADFKRILANNAKLIRQDGGERPTPQPTSGRRPAPSS